MDYSHIKKPELPYRYEFSPDEAASAKQCVDAHGFAILKRVLPDAYVEDLKKAILEAVDPAGDLKPGESRTHFSFVETSPAVWKLLDYAPFMRIHRTLIGADDLTLHRSAAIIRKPGSDPVAWHTDWHGFMQTTPVNSGDVLNRGPWPSGKWFYLTGSRPIHGGLAVIADSHVENWQGPRGFKLTEGCRSFYPEGEEPQAYKGFDVPGLIPLFTDPGDMILFAHRTYHGAFPNRTDETRLSCGIGFRPRHHRIEAPWPLPDSAKAFVAALPERLRVYADGYTGIDMQWRGGQA